MDPVTWLAAGPCHGLWTKTPCTPEDKFCLWHRDCLKADWTVANFLADVYKQCWVDPLDKFPGDAAQIPARDKLLDALHWNKNSINGFTMQLYKDNPHLKVPLTVWLKKHKEGVVQAV